jgi:Ig-like domain-containing protein
MSIPKTKLFAWLMALGMILACVPSFTAPQISTPVPGAVNTFIAQTSDAASTRTAAAMPTFTPTATTTPTPRNTDTPVPTETPTFIFLLPTLTPIPTFTRVTIPGGGGGGSGSGGGGSNSSSYSCQVISVDPPNGTAFNSRDDFDAVWRVRNNGQKAWDRNSVDYIFLSGDQFHKVSGYDLSSNVKAGETLNLTADMQAPKNAGTYTTRWTLRVGSNNFCTLSLSIVVR